MMVLRRNNSAPVQVAEVTTVITAEETEIVVEGDDDVVAVAVEEIRPRRGGIGGRTELLQKQERQCLITKKAQKVSIKYKWRYIVL